MYHRDFNRLPPKYQYLLHAEKHDGLTEYDKWPYSLQHACKRDGYEFKRTQMEILTWQKYSAAMARWNWDDAIVGDGHPGGLDM